MLPVQITIRDVPNSTALEDHIRKRAEKLNHFYQRIHTCKIVIDFFQKSKHQGKLYNVRIDLTLPGKELVVNRKKDEDVYVAIRDAFKALERQLESFVHQRRGDVKSHEAVDRGSITKLFGEEEYGFIQGIDGNEYYFNLENVAHPTFSDLRIGDSVQFIGVTSGEGRQAKRVTKDRHNNHHVTS